MTRSIEDRLNAPPAKGWTPEVGETLIGEIVSMSIAPGTNWGPYPLIVVQPDEGEPVAVHAFHTILRRELEGQRPTEGDRIGIKYFGERQTRGGTDYEYYTVALDRRTPLATAASAPTSAPPAAPASPNFDDDPFGDEPF